jgi:hypothetical protein
MILAVREVIMRSRVHVFLAVGTALILAAATCYHAREHQQGMRGPANTPAYVYASAATP